MEGKRIAHYEVAGKIGSGAMGEVYLGRDTKLDRKVAIKVLTECFAARPDGLHRFEREAKLLAALNHPHIATVFGIEEFEGNSAIVMELVDGETLQERLSKGALTLSDVLTTFTQIAGALAAAHEKGIIHRDLKPGNIKFGSDGSIKVLDFGLAKAVLTLSESTDSEASTLPMDTTEPGSVMGTPAYMSPEQTRGQPVDKRTDVWAFGCCLYQALTGCKPFDADTVSDVMAAVLKNEPDFTALHPATPREIVSILKGCLHKDPRRRLRDLGDVALRLDAIEEADPASIPTSEAQIPRSGIIALALVSALLAGMAVWLLKPESTSTPTQSKGQHPQAAHGQHSELETGLPPSHSLYYQWGKAVGVSPDGSTVALIGEATDGSGERQLFRRTLAELVAVSIPGTEGVFSFDFSPGKGTRIAFLSKTGLYREGALKIVDHQHGTPVVVCDSPYEPVDVSWDDAGIVFGSKSDGIYIVEPKSGSTPVAITERGPGEAYHRSPQLIREGTAVLYTAHDGHSRFDSSQIVFKDLISRKVKVIKDGGYDARLLANGCLVYMQNGRLFSVRLDLETLQIGDPVEVMDEVFSFGAPAQFNLSDQGTLVYLRGRGDDIFRVNAVQPSPAKLEWISSDGSPKLFLGEDYYCSFRISPDGLKVAYALYKNGQTDIFYSNIEDRIQDQISVRLTDDEAQDFHPIWTRDSESVVFSSNRKGQPNIYQASIRASPGTEPLQLTDSPNYQVPHAWIPPEFKKLVILESVPAGNEELVIVDPENLEGPNEPLLPPSHFVEYGAQFTPDGAWFAFGSNRNQQYEVFVNPFPNPDDEIPTQVTNLDVPSERPRWLAGDPPRLFFASAIPDSKGKYQVQSLTYHLEGRKFVPGDLSVWDGGIFDPYPFGPCYDVYPDGSKILIRKVEENSKLGEMTPVMDHFVLFRDFDERLKELVPD